MSARIKAFTPSRGTLDALARFERAYIATIRATSDNDPAWEEYRKAAFDIALGLRADHQRRVRRLSERVRAHKRSVARLAPAIRSLSAELASSLEEP